MEQDSLLPISTSYPCREGAQHGVPIALRVCYQCPHTGSWLAFVHQVTYIVSNGTLRHYCFPRTAYYYKLLHFLGSSSLVAGGPPTTLRLQCPICLPLLLAIVLQASNHDQLAPCLHHSHMALFVIYAWSSVDSHWWTLLSPPSVGQAMQAVGAFIAVIRCLW